MFSLDEIKSIRKQYVLRDFKTLEARKKDGTITLPENLSDEEKMKIVSAIFLYRKIKDVQSNAFQGKKSEEEILDEIQSNFPQQALSTKPKSVSGFVLIAGRPIDVIMSNLAKPNGDMNYMAETYLQYTLAKHGKHATNIQRSIDGGQVFTISYDIEELKKENNFKKQLDPTNPMYTQIQKKISLTSEQLAHRKEIVERLIADYKKMEHDEWYESRAQKEDTDMQRIANVVNRNEIINSSIKGPGLFRLLIAAQNLSLDGEQNFLEEMLKQPAVNDALLELKKSGQVHTIHTQAQENEKNGRVNTDGLLESHSLTHGEMNIRVANQFISEHPNAVSVAKKKLNERNSFLIKYGDTATMREARLVEVVARTQGKSITRTTDENKNRILQVDDGKEQTK